MIDRSLYWTGTYTDTSIKIGGDKLGFRGAKPQK